MEISEPGVVDSMLPLGFSNMIRGIILDERHHRVACPRVAQPTRGWVAKRQESTPAATRWLKGLPMRSATSQSASPVLNPADQLTDDAADSCRFAARPAGGRVTLRNEGDSGETQLLKNRPQLVSRFSDGVLPFTMTSCLDIFFLICVICVICGFLNPVVVVSP